jgi:hypothetical protein
VRVGHTRVWAVHSTNEISPAIADLAANQTVLDAKAEAAQETADLAVAEAALARAEYASMVADGILDRAEKRRLVERFEGYTAERPAILAEASNQNVTTERSAYDAAYAALKNYLESMVPAYDDTSADTVIDPSAYIANLVGYDLAKSTVLTAIANKAAQTAAWGSVTGPGKPEDNATVGAPGDTPVGNSTGNQVVSKLDQATQTISELEALIGNIPADSTVAQEIRKVAAAEIGGNLLPNSDFAAGTAGWGLATTTPQEFYFATDNTQFSIPGEHYAGLLCKQPNGDLGAAIVSDWVPVTPGQWVQVSAWLASRECTALVRLQWGGGGGGYLSDGADSAVINGPRGWENLDGWQRVWTKGRFRATRASPV